MESKIKNAIETSRNEDRIVHLADLTKAELLDLQCESDDDVRNGDVHEYWGDDWRIHVEIESQEVA